MPLLSSTQPSFIKVCWPTEAIARCLHTLGIDVMGSFALRVGEGETYSTRCTGLPLVGMCACLKGSFEPYPDTWATIRLREDALYDGVI